MVKTTMDKLPYLTVDLAGIGGEFKVYPEDFYVEEIPRYEPSGEGEHTYLCFEKRGLTTLEVVNRVAQSLGLSAKRIGYAGLKDAHAVTRQTISIGGASPDQVASLNLSNINVISVSRHRNKIRVGHLAGNKFVIRIREVNQSMLAQAKAVLDQLQQQGVPNYYGQQRFGVRENSHRLGLALMQDDLETFLTELLGRPHPDEMEQAQRARQAYDERNLTEALRLWPKSLRGEWQILRQLVETGDERQALTKLDKRLKRLYLSAYQSYLFNQLLAQRLPNLNRLEKGDVAYIHRNGASFVVQQPEVEQPRVDAFEISPAGPLFGLKYLPASAEPAQREFNLLNNAGLSLQAFDVPGVRLEGGRRPYRIPITEVDVWWDEGLCVSFSLPPGGYATMVLREMMKAD